MRIELGNMADVPENDLLDPGEYEVTVVSGEVRQNKAGTGQYINWVLEVKSDDEALAGVQLYYMMALPSPSDPPKSLRFKKQQIKRFLNACGLDGNSSEFDIEDVIGSTVTAVVENEVFEGEPRNRVRAIR